MTHNDQGIWSSLPGDSLRLAPRLLAEWGEDRTRYADANSVQTLAGTAPVPFQSGNYAKAHKRFACLKPLRNALQQFAWQSRPALRARRCEVLRECGEHLRQRSCPSGSRVAPLPNVTPGPGLLHRLPQPATAFPTPGVGCCHQTTPIASSFPVLMF